MTTSLLSTVYLNEARGSFLGFHTSDEAPALRQAASFELTMPETAFCDTAVYAALEVVFEQLNIDHPTAAWALDYRRRGNRSLSVGDVVVLGETAWAVGPVGWIAITTDELTAATVH